MAKRFCTTTPIIEKFYAWVGCRKPRQLNLRVCSGENNPQTPEFADSPALQGFICRRPGLRYSNDMCTAPNLKLQQPQGASSLLITSLACAAEAATDVMFVAMGWEHLLMVRQNGGVQQRGWARAPYSSPHGPPGAPEGTLPCHRRGRRRRAGPLER